MKLIDWLLGRKKPGPYEKDADARLDLVERQLIAQEKLGKMWVAAERSQFKVNMRKIPTVYPPESPPKLTVVKK